MHLYFVRIYNNIFYALAGAFSDFPSRCFLVSGVEKIWKSLNLKFEREKEENKQFWGLTRVLFTILVFFLLSISHLPRSDFRPKISVSTRSKKIRKFFIYRYLVERSTQIVTFSIRLNTFHAPNLSFRCFRSALYRHFFLDNLLWICNKFAYIHTPFRTLMFNKFMHCPVHMQPNRPNYLAHVTLYHTHYLTHSNKQKSIVQKKNNSRRARRIKAKFTTDPADPGYPAKSGEKNMHVSHARTRYITPKGWNKTKGWGLCVRLVGARTHLRGQQPDAGVGGSENSGKAKKIRAESARWPTNLSTGQMTR